MRRATQCVVLTMISIRRRLGTHHLISGGVRKQAFFYVSSKNFFVVCFPYYVGYHLLFFLVNIFFTNFDNKLFFLPKFSTNFFFLTFVATNNFFNFFYQPPPPPDIKWCVPKLTSVIKQCLMGMK